MNTPRQLVDTAPFVAHPRRRNRLEGEVLPPDPDRALVPAGSSRPPIISINLPKAGAEADDDLAAMVWERRKVQLAVSLESDVRVPLAQSLITALSFGITAAALTWVFGWSWKVPVVVMGLAVAWSWLWRLRLVDDLLWDIEAITGRDINRDGRVGKPARSYVVANPTQARDKAAQSRRQSAREEERDALVVFVHRCYALGCSEAAHNVKASGPNRQEYVARRDVLLSLGVARWKNPARPRSGWTMAVSEAEALALVNQHVL